MTLIDIPAAGSGILLGFGESAGSLDGELHAFGLGDDAIPGVGLGSMV